MPTSIPYDPSLVLMSVVSEEALTNVEAISKLQSPVDAAHDALNSLISSKRGLTMTKTELRNLGIGTDALDEELKKLNAAVEKAAVTYATAKMAAEPQIMQLRQKIHSVHRQIESPVDYLRSEIKTMPLAADTMNMDVQYFSFDSNSQNSAAYSAQIASYVSGAVSSVFGTTQSMKIGTAASRQVSRQVSSHSIEGTLVLSVSCTHKNASIVAPFVLHIDKAIKVWNHLFPGKKLDPTSGTSMMKCAMNESQEDKQKFSIISGTTFGSSFIGMVHVLNSTHTSASESMEAAAMSMQRTMDTGAWFAKAEGKVGVNAKFASDVKNLLSQQNVQSHVTVLTMGVIPSMVANEVSIAVEKFANFDPKANMEAVAAIQNATSSEQATVQSMAEASRTSGQASEMQGKAIEASLSALATIDDGKNKILDVNSMMTALDDYLKKAAQGDSGVPINYYLKDIDQKMLAQMWAAKYYPGKFMSIKYDDTEAESGEGGQEKAKL
ncbi:uncharacterized protein PODANS_5_10810 [Podospora anserina S mat+]|uniref:Podospora anserina S mat+ genomic DNA chromosome 5, supercontig 10 n=1 Tax=Podospora anserina (strain S / ATCC MYA-4624 / DSM 980 / FGSC 10383) TaxID=515849 RepID=B2APF6_PODAN|nr:uncharacterized protein PODANS_5_10810 [Podospora anserina S mat+]CAP65873.1 unnamed protein product [Podospora anserina S mat+]CDP30265.1 Putative protein of unknown function [Podospora anserina S mat+]